MWVSYLHFSPRLLFLLGPQHTHEQANLPFPTPLTFCIQLSFYWPQQKSNWIGRPFVSRGCLLSFLNHRELNYLTKEWEGMSMSSFMLPRVVREPFWSLLKTHHRAWGMMLILLPLWMKNFYLLGGGPENRTSTCFVYTVKNKSRHQISSHDAERWKCVCFCFEYPGFSKSYFLIFLIQRLLPSTPYFWGENIRYINRKKLTLL